MPSKNKPKRLDRNKSWRVARRKSRRAALSSGGSRNRKKRPKNKGAVENVSASQGMTLRPRSTPKALNSGAKPKVPVKKTVKKD
tara:strand:+ start:1730 stop:1981 length:252 start_codon:yes stop_codon:yes gene_type:complete